MNDLLIINSFITKCDNKINKVFYILTTRELSMKRKDLPDATLTGPPRLYQVSGPPLDVQRLNNRLYISYIQIQLTNQPNFEK